MLRSCWTTLAVLAAVASCRPPNAPVSPEPSDPESEVAPRQGGDPTSFAIRIDGLDSHQAAQFVADLYQVSVLVADAGGRKLTLEIRPRDPDEALRAIAEAAGLALVRHGTLAILATEERLEALSAPATPLFEGGEVMDLRVDHGDAQRLVVLLRDVARIEVRGAVTGQFSVWATKVDSRSMLWVVLAVSGAGPIVENETIVLQRQGSFPRTPLWTTHPCPRPRDKKVELACATPDTLVLGGIALGIGGDVRVVLFDRHSGESAIVTEGDWVGKPPTEIEEIDSRGVTFAGGLRLSLP